MENTSKQSEVMIMKKFNTAPAPRVKNMADGIFSDEIENREDAQRPVERLIKSLGLDK